MMQVPVPQQRSSFIGVPFNERSIAHRIKNHRKYPAFGLGLGIVQGLAMEHCTFVILTLLTRLIFVRHIVTSDFSTIAGVSKTHGTAPPLKAKRQVFESTLQAISNEATQPKSQ
jgi:hypothetical protein